MTFATNGGNEQSAIYKEKDMSETQLPADIAASCTMPVIADTDPNWKLEDLENVLLQANEEAARKCLAMIICNPWKRKPRTAE